MIKKKAQQIIDQINNGYTVSLSYKLFVDFMVACKDYKLKCNIKCDGDSNHIILKKDEQHENKEKL
jgi:hypothetical protein